MSDIFKMKKIYHQFESIKDALPYIHSLSTPSKMEVPSYSTSASNCKMGGKLHEIKGSVCEHCYARKGHYNIPVVKTAHEIRLKRILHEPLWVDAMIYILLKKRINKKPLDKFRWHDSGDIQSIGHLKKIAEVASMTPNIKHWLPTKEVNTVKAFMKENTLPDNLIIRLSAFYVNGEPAIIPDTVSSVVITKDRLGIATGFDCPIYNDSNHGKSCGNCEACYDKDMERVNYVQH